MTSKAIATTPLNHAQPLGSRAVLVLTGLSYLFVGFGFSYLDRNFGSFGLECILWLVWALLGFGAGTFNLGKSDTAGQTQWMVLGLVGLVLALFPGLAMYSLLRWGSITLMIVMGARAAMLRTRRDFYFTMCVIFVVSFMVVTHGNADWTLWFYLAPAWVFGGVALAWDHAADMPLSRWTKLMMTLGFMVCSFVLVLLLFFFAPRPPILGFGFLPPGTDTPGMFKQDQGTDGQKDNGGKGGGSASGTNQGQGKGGSGTTQQGGWGQRWDAMLKGMRQSAADPNIPQWQRSFMDKLLGAAQDIVNTLSGRAQPSQGQEMQGKSMQEQSQSLVFRINWVLLLLLLLAGYLLWHYRYKLGLKAVLGGAWLLARWYPAQSMRLSALALKWCLHIHGHKRRPGQSVREHLVGAPGVPPLARRWLGYAVESYCAMRFGGTPADTKQAINMRKDVMGACDILMGAVPELAK